MSTSGRLQNGDLLLSGEVDERSPAVVNGLVAHFPFDGTCYDHIGGHNPIQTTETNVNLIEGHELDWRDPNNWTLGGGSGTLTWDPVEQALVVDGCRWIFFNGYIAVDPSKSWYVEANVKKIGSTGTFYLGCNSFDKNKARVPAHPGSYDYFGAGGRTVGSSWTFFKNTQIGGAPRTGTSTVTSDYDKWDPNTAYIQPMLICNYSAGVVGTDKTWIKDLNWYYTGSNNSNLTTDYNGVNIEASTTNMLSNSSFENNLSSWGLWGSPPTREISSSMSYYGGKSLHLITNDTNQGVTQSISVTAGVTYTLSAWYYVISGQFVLMVNGAGLTYPSVDTNTGFNGDGQWHRISMTITPTITGTLNIYVGRNGGGIAGECYVDCVQFEAKQYPTSYTESSRVANGQLQLPGHIVNFNEGTISCWFKPSAGFFSTESWNRLFGHSTAVNANEIQVKRNNTGTNLVMSISNDAGSPQTSWSSCPSSTIIADQWYHVVARWSISNQRMSLTVDGVKSEQAWISTYQPTVSGTFSVGYHDTYGARWSNSQFKDFSIYNRELTDDEVKKLYKRTFSIKLNGNLVVNSLIEKPNDILNNSIYFPLDSEAKDFNKTILPLNEANTVYENGAVWLGDSTANLLINPSFTDTSNWTLSTNGTGTFTTDGKWGKINVPNESGYYYYLFQAITRNTPANTPVTFSVTFRNNTIGRFSLRLVMFEGASAVQQPQVEVNLDGTGVQKRYSVTASHTAISSELRLDILAGSYYSSFGGLSDASVEFTNAQLEEKPYMTPFVDGTRGYTRLNYTGSQLTPNNWQEFTLIYWAKYSDGGRWRISGAWSRFYFGPGTSNILNFAWVGYLGAGDTTREQHNVSGGTVPIGKWVMIGCSVKNNTFIDLYVNGVRTLNYTGTPFELNDTAMNFEFNSIDTSSTSYPLNAWVKDAIFVPRALNELEMQSIYKTQMRSHKDGVLQIAGQVNENATI